MKRSQFARSASLFAIENSLFHMQGIRPDKLAKQRFAREARGVLSQVSLYFPIDQGILAGGDSFAVASQHSHTKYLL